MEVIKELGKLYDADSGWRFLFPLIDSDNRPNTISMITTADIEVFLTGIGVDAYLVNYSSKGAGANLLTVSIDVPQSETQGVYRMSIKAPLGGEPSFFEESSWILTIRKKTASLKNFDEQRILIKATKNIVPLSLDSQTIGGNTLGDAIDTIRAALRGKMIKEDNTISFFRNDGVTALYRVVVSETARTPI